MLIIGDIHTSLLRTSQPLSTENVADLLSLRPGRQVTATDRPVNRTVSPDTVLGVDCTLATDPPTRARGIGTVASHAVVVGGTVVQASARTVLEWADYRERREWAHYARRRGVIDVLGDPPAERVIAGTLKPRPADTLDLGAVCQRILTQVQTRPQLDRRVRLRTRPTRLRWHAIGGENLAPSATLHIDSDVQRSVRVVVPSSLMTGAIRLCEDLALHDWLYTALENVIDQAQRHMATGTDPVDKFDAALDLLVRVWMPGAHIDQALRPLWDDLQRDGGFSQGWDRNVAWIRDKVSVGTLKALRESRLV